VGIRSALRAVQDSENKDARLLVGLAARAGRFDGLDMTGDEANWQKLMDLSAQGIADVIVEASKLPEFALIGMDLLRKILERVQDDSWSKWLDFWMLASSAENHGPHQTAPNSQGVELHWRYANKDVSVFPRIDRSVMPDTIRLGGMMLVISRVWMETSEGIEEEANEAIPTEIAASSCLHGACSRLWPEDSEGSFRSKITKLHKQCLALVRFYAGVRNIDPESVSMEDAWRYFRDLECKQCKEILQCEEVVQCEEILRLGINSCLRQIQAADSSYFTRFNSVEMEIILSKNYTNAWKNIMRLSILSQWAIHKSRQLGSLQAGDLLRVSPECEHADWRGKDCVVTKIDGPRVETRIHGGEHKDHDISIVLDTELFYDAGKTVMLRFFERFTNEITPVESFSAHLSAEQAVYVMNFEGFYEMIRHAVEASFRTCTREMKQKIQSDANKHIKENIEVARNGRSYSSSYPYDSYSYNRHDREEDRQAHFKVDGYCEDLITNTCKPVCAMFADLSQKAAEFCNGLLSKNREQAQLLRQLEDKVERSTVKQDSDSDSQETIRRTETRVDSLPIELRQASIGGAKSPSEAGFDELSSSRMRNAIVCESGLSIQPVAASVECESGLSIRTVEDFVETKRCREGEKEDATEFKRPRT
jgi:hypothetical protein